MNKLRIGVVGAGGIARKRTIPGILKAQNVELTAIMDVSEEILAKVMDDVRKDFGDEKADKIRLFTDWKALISSEDVDIVYIGSPVFAHKEQVLACAEYKKSVLCEKPVGRDTKEVEEMIRACREAKIHAGTAFMMRFHTFHRQLKEMIEQGKFGRIVSARVQQVFWYPEIPGAWRQIKALSGGGAMMDVGVHNIDLAEFLMGSRTAAVTGFTETRTFHYDVDDICTVLIKLENGTVCYIDGAFSEHGPVDGSLLEIYGTKGSCVIRGSVGQTETGTVEGMLIGEDGRREKLELTADFTDLYMKEVDAFAASVMADEPEPVPMEQGLWIQKVAEACYLSQESGKVEKVG